MSDDPIARLRELYTTLEPPAWDADADTEPADERTRAAVDWMRAAWAELDAPVTRPTPRPAGLLAPLAGALAAGLLALLALRARSAPDESRPRRAPELAAPAPMHASPRLDGSLEVRSGALRLVLCPPPNRGPVGLENETRDDER